MQGAKEALAKAELDLLNKSTRFTLSCVRTLEARVFRLQDKQNRMKRQAGENKKVFEIVIRKWAARNGPQLDINGFRPVVRYDELNDLGINRANQLK